MSISANNDLHQTESSAPAVPTIQIVSSINNVSPIQELPRELMEEIFLYHTPPDGFKALCVRNDCWTLLNLCQSWRDVATRCPRLWRHIDVPVRVLAAKCSNPVALLSLIVSRAQAMDVFITFDASPVEDDAGNVADNLSILTFALFEVLLDRSAQWRTIQLIEVDTLCMCFLERVRGGLPRLTELDVQTHVEALWGTLSFTTAPLLKRICLVFPAEVVVHCIPGQAQLTEFSVEGSYYDSSLVNLLRHCPLLKALGMRFLLPSPPVDKRVSSQITDFTFGGQFFSDLTLVRLPQLRTLSISDIDGISLETILPSVLDLVKHSRCPLESLGLINCDLAGLVAVLELVCRTLPLCSTSSCLTRRLSFPASTKLCPR
ncbi:hypothetical protein BDZ89DRAFT_391295 [Hymenopellis radicata]|nr:hypothetical protein BDZ89DRAFT_391295 [Hymenopellis radicata]